VKTLRKGVALAIGLMLLVTLLAVVIQPLLPWLLSLFVLVVIYGALIRD
jgi:hypothetical protein